MWIHIGCGGEIVSELQYSDAENDYHFPICAKCQSSVPIREARHAVEIPYDHTVSGTASNSPAVKLPSSAVYPLAATYQEALRKTLDTDSPREDTPPAPVTRTDLVSVPSGSIPALLYRVEEFWLGGDELIINLLELPVVKATPRGYWVQRYNSAPWLHKFVLSSARKRYAYPTQQEAYEAYYLRKKRQVHILLGQLKRAKQGLSKAGELTGRTNETPKT